MHPIITNLLERYTQYSLEARDWILHATSEDGVTWVKDTHFFYNPLPFWGYSMSYYATKDQQGNLWYHSSIKTKKTPEWHSILRSPFQKLHARDLGYKQLFSPCFINDMLYTIAVDDEGRYHPLSFKVLNKQITRTNPLIFSDNQYGTPSDLFVIRDQDEWYLWATMSNKIYQWHSKNGLHWTDPHLAIESPFCPSWYEIANNPCVVKTQKGWRLYFRSGTEPAVDNRIYSAFSNDLHSWSQEPGERIIPGGERDFHGVGFPYVYYDPITKKWHMYYAGFWGNSKAGHKTAALWKNQNSILKKHP